MKKQYRIEVDCANCAAKMERACADVPGVKAVSISFMAQKMSVEFEEGADIAAAMKETLKRCKKIDSDCEIAL